MEAVIATGGKQYRVAPGQVISVERLPGDRGAPVEFRSVLLVQRDGAVLTGETLARAKVSGEIVAQRRRRKIAVVKFKRRKNYRRHHGHRQATTDVRIVAIEV